MPKSAASKWVDFMLFHSVWSPRNVERRSVRFGHRRCNPCHAATKYVVSNGCLGKIHRSQVALRSSCPILQSRKSSAASASR